jgi:hypothetical protein
MGKWHTGLKILAFILSFFMAFPCSIVFAATVKATTQIKHESPAYYIPGFRIILDADIKDEAGLLVARCYFKTKKDKNFVFVDMLPKGNPGYQATLPAPWVNSESIEYVLVAVSKDKKVVRTQVFTMPEKETKQAVAWREASEVKEIRLDEAQEVLEQYKAVKKDLREEYNNKLPKWQLTEDSGKLGVFTEFEGASGGGQLKGFYDTITVTTVSSSSKYGVMAEGLYTEEEIADLGGKTATASATGATNAGTISAAAGGISFGTIAIGAAAIAAGAAAAGSGGGGGDDSVPAPSTSSGLSDVVVSQTNITITVWDDGLVDGDQVDLTVNGISVFNNYVLSGPPGTTRNVLLNSGNNILLVQADNEGGTPPNTAAITISNVISGNPDQSWSLISGQTTTMTISAP